MFSKSKLFHYSYLTNRWWGLTKSTFISQSSLKAAREVCYLSTPLLRVRFVTYRPHSPGSTLDVVFTHLCPILIDGLYSQLRNDFAFIYRFNEDFLNIKRYCIYVQIMFAIWFKLKKNTADWLNSLFPKVMVPAPAVYVQKPLR